MFLGGVSRCRTHSTLPLFCMIVLLSSMAGCSLPFLKAKEPKKPISAALERDPQSGKLTQAGLQAQVMGFANQYVHVLSQAFDEILLSGVEPQGRATINTGRVHYTASALSIAGGRNPAANFLDMVVFITLGRMIIEDQWVPKIYGPKFQPLLVAYRDLEKEIWAMAAQVLSPAQQEALRTLIREWRAAHPKQYYFGNVRLNDFAALRGASPLAVEKETQGLLATVEKSLVKVDEAFLLAERVMYYLEQMPRIVTFQTQLIVDQATTNPEVQRMVNDVNQYVAIFAGLAKTAENLPGQFSAERKATIKELSEWAHTERQEVWKDLEREEPRLKGMLTELRQVLVAATELTTAMQALVIQFKRDLNISPETPVDYVKALQHTSETVKEATLLIKSLNDFVGGKTAEEANLVKGLRQVNAETRAILNHAFWLVLILMLVFLAGLVVALWCYRYFTRRLVDSPRS
jgi:hypothetical protein